MRGRYAASLLSAVVLSGCVVSFPMDPSIGNRESADGMVHNGDAHDLATVSLQGIGGVVIPESSTIERCDEAVDITVRMVKTLSY